MTRTSTLMVRADPSRSTSPSCRTRSTLAWVLALMSPTSSRKIVPRSACSNLPTCFSVAPVNDPFSWPNSSDSISSSGIAAQFTCTNRSPAAQAVAVDRARDQLLADAALALDQHRRVGRRRAADRSHDLPQRAAVADHLVPDFDRALQRPVLVAQLPLIQRVAQADQHPVAGERLLDEIERALLGRLDRRADRAVAGDDDDRQRLVHRAQPLEHFEAVHAGHLDVEQHQVGRLALGERQPLLPGRGQDALVALRIRGHPQRVADGRLVVDDQDAGFGHVGASTVVDP